MYRKQTSKNERIRTRFVNFSNIKNALKNIQQFEHYYCLGYLFIKFKDMPNVALKGDGKSWSFIDDNNGHIVKNMTFVMSNSMELVVKNMINNWEQSNKNEI